MIWTWAGRDANPAYTRVSTTWYLAFMRLGNNIVGKKFIQYTTETINIDD